MLYPYRIRIREQEIINLLQKLAKYRTVPIPNKEIAMKLGKKISPIRSDVFLVPDTKFYRSYIGLMPHIKLEYKPAYGKRKGYDFFFKSLF